MTSGVYIIKNLKNGFSYIGSSVDIYARVSSHFSSLINGNHCNKDFQNDFNLYGISNFTSDNLCFCLIDELENKEQFFIDSFDKLYNKRTSLIGSHARNRTKRIVLRPKISVNDFKKIKEIAKTENRSVNNLIETWLKEKVGLLK